MAHKFNPNRAARLEDPERKKILDPARVLAPLELIPGLHVADIGCGVGHFTIPLAFEVQERGKVLAIDISRELLAKTEENVRAAGLTNVDLIVSSETSVPLPPSVVEAALVANVLHEVDGQRAFLQEIRRLLKDSGSLLVVEWKKEETPRGPRLKERLVPDQVIELAQEAGFGNPVVHEVGPHHYGVKFNPAL